MSSRERILARLRQAAVGDSPRVPQAVSSDRVWPAPDKADWLDALCQNLRDNHAEVLLTDQQTWMADLLARLQKYNVSRLLCGNHDTAARLQQYIQSQSDDIDTQRVTTDIEKEVIFQQVDAGFSVASAALAETGSLVIETGPQEPRTVSLVPPLNIILVRQSQLQADFSAWAASTSVPDPMPTNLLLISGPSKTADIQQTLAYGAHGPKSLIVVMLTDA
ncbi:MAG: hypothetical protein CMI02_15815 [Oceanospirillaceae bacterium]|nr:hypothetical protein [Oceanospirillaceae bacterium]MBT13488.1 hypothetical protein [Oceanospirillaceae bacterium]